MSDKFVMSQDDTVELWNSASGDYFEAQLVDYAAKAITFYTDTLPGSAANASASIPPIFYNGETKRDPALRAACEAQALSGIAIRAAAPTTGSAPEEFDAQAAAMEATRRATQSWLEKHAPAQAYSYERCGVVPTPIDAKLAPTQGEDARPAYKPHTHWTYCTPRDNDGPRFMIVFDDADRPPIILTDGSEEKARELFARLENNWNCHLYELAKREPVGADARPVGKIIADDPVHGWHMEPLVPWEEIGADTLLYATHDAAPILGYRIDDSDYTDDPLFTEEKAIADDYARKGFVITTLIDAGAPREKTS
ncbi:hypothetical protein EOS_41565 [Caballeronia mineralivorans PML1(12)]|uniref:Uncharacterized protein n=1 Tax=Caballeronia mineralivorans PML1(12) TaxID=908627 RepID=A0A0J1CIF9_9BURK|nr:hypothetical protein [Caballeronia mineralivorans]KLU20354.1 hypothetical protein EOS_41565 [Caballeronia mineralivorans PML1(12)]